MSVTIGIASRLLLRAALASLVVLSASAATAQSITGTAAYRERMALPPSAVFEAVLEDVSRADAPAETIARTRIDSPGNPPIAFTITYDPARIVANHRYVVRARILVDDEPLFITETAPAVITSGNPTSVSIMLRRASANQSAQPAASSAKSLEGTYWRATELAGKPVPKQDAKREAHVVFQPGGRFSGSDGCNQITGTYQLKGDAVTFGKMIATQMACLNTGGTEQAFRDAIQSAARLAVVGDRLELADAVGRRVVV
ncbi:MAG: YbaY family lipoprotein, partial [Vicinamibacterales bacterium]